MDITEFSFPTCVMPPLNTLRTQVTDALDFNSNNLQSQKTHFDDQIMIHLIGYIALHVSQESLIKEMIANLKLHPFTEKCSC